jgi:hypothetical protein
MIETSLSIDPMSISARRIDGTAAGRFDGGRSRHRRDRAISAWNRPAFRGEFFGIDAALSTDGFLRVTTSELGGAVITERRRASVAFRLGELSAVPAVDPEKDRKHQLPLRCPNVCFTEPRNSAATL